jgi:hypothetical protein
MSFLRYLERKSMNDRIGERRAVWKLVNSLWGFKYEITQEASGRER